MSAKCLIAKHKGTVNHLALIAVFCVFLSACGHHQTVNTAPHAIEEKIAKDILSLPEMKFEKAAMMIAGDPSDKAPYYTVKAGSNMETHFATCHWFHVYPPPQYAIMYYDVASDTEMTLDAWRALRK